MASLPQLQTALKSVTARGAKAIGQLEDVPGVGKNTASKLMVICYPKRYAVLNEPVIKALKHFGVDMNSSGRLDARVYDEFMRRLQPFIKALPKGLLLASALDSFFIHYQSIALD